MEKKNKYYVVRDKALPEVLQKVVEVKRLLEADKNMTVQEAAEQGQEAREEQAGAVSDYRKHKQ